MECQLDMHSQMLLDEFVENRPSFEKLCQVVKQKLTDIVAENGLYVTAIEARVKTVESLSGKLELKGHKYHFLSDITDLLGARVVAFYSDDVDKIATLIERHFEIDWDNSVDKRKILDLDRFGYMSLHYICRLPKTIYFDPEHPELNDIPFEVQMRTALQHVWATMFHDTGYKSATGVDIPKEHLRNLNRLAGLLELADEQFGRIRIEINDYRRQVKALVADGNFDELELNGDSFDNYLAINPFKKLLDKIASINQAEIYNDSIRHYLKVLQHMGLKTLGDVERMRVDCEEGAYQLSLHQFTGTDLDILAQSVAIQNTCIVYIVKRGGSPNDLRRFYDYLYGKNNYNESRAKKTYDQVLECRVV